MCIYLYSYVYIYIYIYMYMYICICISLSLSIYIYISSLCRVALRAVGLPDQDRPGRDGQDRLGEEDVGHLG